MFAVLELQDFAIIAMLVALFAGSSAYASFPSRIGARLHRLELKVDAIIQHLGIELQAGLPKGGLSTKVRELADDGKKIEAIRVYREETGTGLKDARDAVEAYLGR
jgi:hypothetical protein